MARKYGVTDEVRFNEEIPECIFRDGGWHLKTSSGREDVADVVIAATGVRADAFIRPTTVVGRDGVNLDDVWEDHPVACLSISIPQFPNFFMLNGPNGPLGNFSLIRIAESQVAYILQELVSGLERCAGELDVNAGAFPQ